MTTVLATLGEGIKTCWAKLQGPTQEDFDRRELEASEYALPAGDFSIESFHERSKERPVPPQTTFVVTFLSYILKKDLSQVRIEERNRKFGRKYNLPKKTVAPGLEVYLSEAKGTPPDFSPSFIYLPILDELLRVAKMKETDTHGNFSFTMGDQKCAVNLKVSHHRRTAKSTNVGARKRTFTLSFKTQPIGIPNAQSLLPEPQ